MRRIGWIAVLLGLCLACQSLWSLPRPGTARAKRPRLVAVTFDDLPAPDDSIPRDDAATMDAMHRKLLAALRKNRIPAVGFVNEGRLHEKTEEFEARVDVLRLWVQAGLELGNHTYSHVDLQATPLRQYEMDVIRGEPITRDLMLEGNKKLRYFRHPYLHVGPDLATRLDLEDFLARRGYVIAPVTVAREEYVFGGAYGKAKANGDDELAARIGQAYLRYMQQSFEFSESASVKTIGYEVRQILLLHASSLNADYMPELIRLARRRGYRFVTLSKALKDRAYRLPDTYTGKEGSTWIHHWAQTQGKQLQPEPPVPQFVADMYEDD